MGPPCSDPTVFSFAGYVRLTLEEDGEEINEAVPCRRYNDPNVDIILPTRGGAPRQTASSTQVVSIRLGPRGT